MPTRRLLTSLGNTSQNQTQITAIRLLAVSRFFLRGVTLKAGVTLEAGITLEAGVALEAGVTLGADRPWVIHCWPTHSR